ncbi:hypothetical protein NL676_009295 [Syzygium grande]|nr:hypothetical protein NL676_009295 [Syzygium grande]
MRVSSLDLARGLATQGWPSPIFGEGWARVPSPDLPRGLASPEASEGISTFICQVVGQGSPRPNLARDLATVRSARASRPSPASIEGWTRPSMGGLIYPSPALIKGQLQLWSARASWPSPPSWFLWCPPPVIVEASGWRREEEGNNKKGKTEKK